MDSSSGENEGRREHRVPLSDATLNLEALVELGNNHASGWVFPGGRAGRPLSNMSMIMLLRRMSRLDLTVHGFRSTFRDWSARRPTIRERWPSKRCRMRWPTRLRLLTAGAICSEAALVDGRLVEGLRAAREVSGRAAKPSLSRRAWLLARVSITWLLKRTTPICCEGRPKKALARASLASSWLLQALVATVLL